MTNVARASMWMALGTIVSRITGFGRLLLLAATIGVALNADLFNIANTIPNAMYVLVAGGIFNVVLVPQLVRAMSRDEDGGEAYAHRLITIGLLALLAATVLLIVAIPLISHLVFPEKLFEPRFSDQLASGQLLMLLCMPQVFFYGAFVLIGQVLNARRRFGPMMWAPIVNNAISCAMLGLYLVIFGSSNGTSGFTTAQSLLLGLGSTAGIIAQTLTLLPFLYRSGFRIGFRFDFRGAGLGHTFRLGVWTLGFIASSQVAYIVIQRLGVRGTTDGADHQVAAAGAAVYEIGFLVSQLPHGVITVSLVTAIMPTLSALAYERQYSKMRSELQRSCRIALTIIAPLAVCVAVLAPAATGVLAVVPSLADTAPLIARTVAAFAPGMVAFCLHFVMLRGFYANEDTRTPFFIQLAVAGTNIGVALVLTSAVSPSRVAQMLAVAFSAAYLVGAVLAVGLLSRVLGPILDRYMVRFCLRLGLALALSATAMYGTVKALGIAGLSTDTPGHSLAVFLIAAVVGAIGFLASCMVLRIDEPRQLIGTVLHR